MKNLLLILSLFFCFHLQAVSSSDVYINTEDYGQGTTTLVEYTPNLESGRKEITRLKKEEKRLVRFESRIKKFQQARQKKHALGLFSDPVNKWFWFWIFGWGLGILLTVISGATITSGFIGILWLTAFFAGSVALIIWLIKKHG